MKRPIPVVLTAIFLGLLAALKLLGLLGMAAAGLLFLRKGFPTPTSSPLPPAFLPILFFGLSLLAAAAAVWSILTLIGLLRLRSWARYSVLVMAGCITLFAGMGMLMSFAMPFLLPSVATQTAAPDSHIIRGVFLVVGVVYGLFTAIGIALLVYYNLATTRAIFLQNAPLSLDPPNTSTGRPRPTAITVISWIYLISGPICLIYVFLPLPTFLFGFVIYGFAAHVTYAAIGILTFAIGYGLLRLRNEARLAVFALFALCPIQLVVLLTPWGVGQFKVYMDAINAKIYAGQQAPLNVASSPALIVFLLLLTTVLYAIVLWLLHRHREAFTPAPAPPPMAFHPDLLAG